MSALTELQGYLKEKEFIEGIVFGPWGWGDCGNADGHWGAGYGEPEDLPVPTDKRGKPLTLTEATPYMQAWSFFGGFGAPECYATYIWTNRRVIWVTQYDGATGLDSMPRHPQYCMPTMPGG